MDAKREILFRGKTKDGEWVYWNELGVINFDLTDTEISLYVHLLNDELMFKTVGQYTGLTDMNGNKIFEGDIVKNALYREMPFIVKYDQSRGGYFPFASGDGCGCCEIETITPNENGQVDVEVIGNIHDNPNY